MKYLFQAAMVIVPLRILIPLLIYHVHLVDVGKIGEVEEKEYRLNDMLSVVNKLEESDPSLHSEILKNQEDFVFSGDDYFEFSGDGIDNIELNVNSNDGEILEETDYYYLPTRETGGDDVISEDTSLTLDIVKETTTSEYNDFASVNAELIEMLRKQEKRCVLYQNNGTSNFIIYC